MHAGQIRRVPAHAARDLGLGDRERHRPGRIEIDRGDIDRQRRRRLVDLADDDAIAPLDLVVGHRLDEGRRNVHHDVALGEGEIEAEQPLQRSFELLDAVADRNIERAQCLRADAAGRVKPVAQLEALDALDDGSVIDVARLLVCRHVAADDEMAAQQRDLGTAHARRKLGVGRQRRPAAAHLDIRIAEQRFLDAQISALVEHRVRRQRQRRGRAHFRRRSRRRCRFRGDIVLSGRRPSDLGQRRRGREQQS